MLSLSKWFSIMTVCIAATVSSATKIHGHDVLFSNRTIFVPPSNYTDPRVLYVRSLQLHDGTLLATWENYSPEPPPVYFPIFRSKDGGQTWKEISRVQDQVYGFGLRYQPFLYLLPQALGGFPAGTILLSGSAIPTNLSSTNIELYASRDNGFTWKFVSHIAAGGEAIPDNGLTPVWEPFLMVHNNKLVAYYSDQRDPAHGQKLSHQVSSDLVHWGPVVNDVAYPTFTDRPGMPVVAKLPNGKFLLTYEYGGGPEFPTYSFPVHYRISADPLNFNDAPDSPLIATDGTIPTSSPYVVWTPFGGVNGTLVVSANSNTEIFTNTALGAGRWNKVNTTEDRSYTRSLRIMEANPQHVLIIGGGHLPPSTTNAVRVGVMALP